MTFNFPEINKISFATESVAFVEPDPSADDVIQSGSEI